MNDVKEPKAVMTVEEAFELTKKHLLFTISDNEGKKTYTEGMGLSSSILEDKNISDIALRIMLVPNKTDIAKIILEKSNSLAEVIIILHACIDSINKMERMILKGLGNMSESFQEDVDE